MIDDDYSSTYEDGYEDGIYNTKCIIDLIIELDKYGIDSYDIIEYLEDKLEEKKNGKISK